MACRTHPGATAFTRIPYGARSMASDRANCATAPFDALYVAWYSSPTNDAVEAVHTIVPPARSAIARPTALRHQVHPAHVDAHRVVEVLERGVQDLLEVGDAGVRRQMIQTSERVERLGHRALRRLGLADVRRDRHHTVPRRADVLGHAVEVDRILRRRHEAEVRALVSEMASDRAADAGGGAGHDRRAASERLGHNCSWPKSA